MRELRSQRGGALLTTLALALAGLTAIALLMDIFGLYVSKRQGQTAADAAALGALQAAEKAFNEAARPAVDNKAAAMMVAVNAEVGQRMAKWEAAQRASLRAALSQIKPPMSDAEINQRIDQIIGAEWYGVYTSMREGAIRSRVRDPAVADAMIGGWTVPLGPGLGEFFTPVERGCLLRDTATRKAGDIQRAAAWFAERNSGQSDVAVVFPYESQIKVRTVVKVPIPLGISARFASSPALPVEATSRAVNPGGLTFDLSGWCG